MINGKFIRLLCVIRSIFLFASINFTSPHCYAGGGN